MFGRSKPHTMVDVRRSQIQAEAEAIAFRNESQKLREDMASLTSEISATLSELGSFSEALREAKA